MTAPKTSQTVLTFKVGSESFDPGSATQDMSITATNLRVDGAPVVITRKTDTEPVYRFSKAQVTAIGAMSDAAYSKALKAGRLVLPAKDTRGRPTKVRLSGSDFRSRIAPAPAPKVTRQRRPKTDATPAPDATPSA
jgi:hypothetical protein